MKWSVTCIESEDVVVIWPVVSPLLAPAVSRSGGRYDMRAVFASLRTEKSLLWVVYSADSMVRAAFIARIAGYPCRSMLSIDFMGGADLAEWLPSVSETLDRFTADKGLDGCEMMGRDGWGKPLAPLGWKRVMGFFEKNLEARSFAGKENR